MEENINTLSVGETWEEPMKWGVRWNVLRVPHGYIFTPINRQFNGNDVFGTSVFTPRYESKIQ